MTTTTTTEPGTAEDLLAVHQPETPQRAWKRLTALRIGERQGWYRYRAGDHYRARYALRLNGPGLVHRVLNRDAMHLRGGAERRMDETLPWLVGHAFGKGHPGVFAGHAGIGECPPLLTAEQAAAALHVSTHSVHLYVAQGELHPLYGARHQRHYFEAEILARTGDPAAIRQWAAIRDRLPDPDPGRQLAAVTETPRPQPLPVAPALTLQSRCAQALEIAEDHGWLRFIADTLDPQLATNVYTIELAVPDDDQPGVFQRVRLRLPNLAVLPFVWGLGDAYICGDDVAYR
jgi:hypothetical protein